MYNNIYGKEWRTLWQYHKDNLNDNKTEFETFKFKAKMTGRIPGW